MAHKKAAGAAKNLRDSQPKYRGIKIFGWQRAIAWNIIVRQKGSKYECGENTYLASDFSIHAEKDGLVMFKQKKFKRFDGRTYLKTVVYVAPEAEVKAEKKAPAKKATTAAKKPAATKTATKKAPAKKQLKLNNSFYLINMLFSWISVQEIRSLKLENIEDILLGRLST